MATTITARRGQVKRGAVLVEFAFVLPIIVTLMVVLLELSRVMLLQHTADTAAYEGARAGMIPGATAEQAQAAAQKLLTTADVGVFDISVTPEDITEETALITVRVEVPVAPNSWISPSRFTDVTLGSEVTLVCERPPVVRLTGVPDKLKAKKSKLQGPKPNL